MCECVNVHVTVMCVYPGAWQREDDATCYVQNEVKTSR